MRKRLIEAGVALLGLVVIALAVASATLWRADDVLVARGAATHGLVVTDPGVLELGGDPVTVHATVPAGDRVVLAVGRDTDVAGWVGSDPYQRVTGLASWRELRFAAPVPTPSASGASTPLASAGSAVPTGSPSAAQPSAAPSASPTTAPTAAPAADPAGSDMWVAQATGTGSAQLVWHAQPGRWSLLVAGIAADGTSVAPTLEMSWPRVVSTPWLVPGLVLGALLVLAAAASFARDRYRARSGHDGWTSVETGPLPEVTPAGPSPALTRRQLRELQSRSGRPPTGAVRAVASADRHAASAGSGPAPADAPHTTSATAEAVTAADAARRAATARSGAAGAPGAPVVSPAQPAAAASWHPVAAAPPAPVSGEQAAPPWAAGSRRARRAAAQGDTDRPGSDVAPSHEGRPAWVPAPTPTSSSATPVARPVASGSAVRPDGSRPPAVPSGTSSTTGSSTTGSSTTGSSTTGSSTTRAVAGPPRPGGWVPAPGAARPVAPGRPPVDGPAAASAPEPRAAHPSWLTPPPAPQRPQAPGSASTPAAGASQEQRVQDEGDDAVSSRADAWRRAWGLPTDASTDDQPKEDR